MRKIKSHIEKNEFSKIYLLYGTDEYMKKNYKEKLTKAIVGDDTMNLSIYNEGNIDLSEMSTDFSKTIQNQSIENVESAVKVVIIEEFAKNGIKSAEVSTFANITEDNRIYITKVEILCNAEEVVLCRNVMDKLSVCNDVNITERK